MPMVQANQRSFNVLSGEIEPSSGNISVSPGKRIAVLKQNQYEFDEFEVRKLC